MNTQINDTRWQPTPELKAILNGLLAEQAQEKSEADFVRKFLPFGASQWSQITGVLRPARLNEKGELVLSYFDKVQGEKREELIAQLAAVLEEIPRQRSISARVKEIKIFKTTKLRAIEQAVREANEKFGPERLVVGLAPTGGGKTIICNYLAEHFNARFVEVRDVWRESKTGLIPLLDICRAVGYRPKKINAINIATVQDGLIKFCEERKIVLCFDEGEHFGKAALNLLKLLLNKTRIVPVIFCVTSEYELWLDYWPNEAAQIARRCHAIIELSNVEPADAKLFFPADAFEKPEQLEFLCRAASQFGHFSLVARVAARLEGITRADHAEVDKAITSAKKQMLRNAGQRALVRVAA